MKTPVATHKHKRIMEFRCLEMTVLIGTTKNSKPKPRTRDRMREIQMRNARLKAKNQRGTKLDYAKIKNADGTKGRREIHKTGRLPCGKTTEREKESNEGTKQRKKVRKKQTPLTVRLSPGAALLDLPQR
jgi:hypothetical protein